MLAAKAPASRNLYNSVLNRIRPLSRVYGFVICDIDSSVRALSNLPELTRLTVGWLNLL